jgi:hypothetical protein
MSIAIGPADLAAPDGNDPIDRRLFETRWNVDVEADLAEWGKDCTLLRHASGEGRMEAS